MIIGIMDGDIFEGFTGSIKTLAFDAQISLVKAPNSDDARAPEWTLLIGDPADGIEIGAGWNRAGSRELYFALQIDDPSLAAPLRANMVRLGSDRRRHSIIWSRPEPRKEKVR